MQWYASMWPCTVSYNLVGILFVCHLFDSKMSYNVSFTFHDSKNEVSIIRFCTGPGNCRLYLNFSLAFSRTGKSLKMRSWKSVSLSNRGFLIDFKQQPEDPTTRKKT